MGKIEHLPSSREMSVETLLHMVLEDLPEIEGIVVIAKGTDDKMWTAWSSMDRGELCMAALYLNMMVQREIR